MLSIASAAYTQEFGRNQPSFEYRRFLENVRTGLEGKQRVEVNRKVAEEIAMMKRRLPADQAERKRIALENRRRRQLRETQGLEDTHQDYKHTKARREDMRIEKEKEEERQSWSQMWTTPCYRPLAEQPIQLYIGRNF